MIHGIGCDILHIQRIDKIIEYHNKKFLDRILTKSEIKNAPTHQENLIRFVAKRFSAKEAFSKALGHGIGDNFGFQDIEILNHKNGKPFVNLLSEKLINDKIRTHISLSDEKEYVISYVVIECY